MHAILKALKRSKEFVWFEECNRALDELKKYLSNPPLISIVNPMSNYTFT